MSTKSPLNGRSSSPDHTRKSSLKSPRTNNGFGKSVKNEKELIKREIYLAPTKWNKFKLFIANSYEISLIAVGLALSIY